MAPHRPDVPSFPGMSGQGTPRYKSGRFLCDSNGRPCAQHLSQKDHPPRSQGHLRRFARRTDSCLGVRPRLLTGQQICHQLTAVGGVHQFAGSSSAQSSMATLQSCGYPFGPIGSALAGLFPTAVRYTGASMAFNPCLRKWIIWAVRPTMTRTKTDPKAPTRIGDFGSVTSG